MRKPLTIRRRSALALLLAVLGGPAAAAPAHYIVFRADPSGALEPVFYRRVELAAAPRTKSDEVLRQAVAQTGREAETLTWSLVDAGGKAVFRDAVAVPNVLRGEFRGAPLGANRFRIDGHRLTPEAAAFVVRAPIVAGTKLIFDGPHPAAFDLEALAREAPSLPLAGIHAALSKAVARAGAGSSANRVDLLILGDGYTADQQAKFDADAATLEGEFFSITPYKEYRNFVKVSSLFIPSAQSGADHPPFASSCPGTDNPACCSDPEAQGDPLRGTYVDTALGGRFCAFNIHRLAVVDDAAAFAAASGVPDWDRLLVLLNDPVYGGSGGSVSVVSLDPASTEVARHEYGHSFTLLTDEYDTPNPGSGTCSDVSGRAACEPNVTDETRRDRVKWGPWIASSTPVPTPQGTSAYAHVAGLFEGGRYETRGIFRPHEDCLMKVLGVPFGEVCSQEYVLRLYRGGWGTPAAGIDPIEPGSETPRPGAVAANAPVTFAVGLLEPAGGPAIVATWWVNGVQVAGATESRFTFVPANPGTYTVEVRVKDPTPLVHPALAGGDLQSSRRWSVTAGAPAVGAVTTPVAPDPRKVSGP